MCTNFSSGNMNHFIGLEKLLYILQFSVDKFIGRKRKLIKKWIKRNSWNVILLDVY